ncbi:MAG: MotA/TolQ/ExbB proton channel family protein [Bacteroidales bacterium]|nr:MotA/TolQ/ExbB proton channel family protein [Bacteroidales bacterium]
MTAANAMQEYESLSILDLAIKGGWIMPILLILSIIAIYIFVERWLVINKAGKEDKYFMDEIKSFIHQGRISEALTLCRMKDSPTARMIEKGISRLGKPLNDINAAIENVGNLEVSRLEKNLTGLATIAGAAPMLGFLGTVMGMVRAFYDMANAGNNIDIQLLSSGIYQAMITTVGGLIVGIIAYIGYNVLVARVDRVIFKLEANTSEFLDLLNEPME